MRPVRIWLGADSANFCTAFVGKIYYLGPGDNPLGYPNLKALPANYQKNGTFHPNCSKRLVGVNPRPLSPDQREQRRPSASDLAMEGASQSQAQAAWNARQDRKKAAGTTRAKTTPSATPLSTTTQAQSNSAAAVIVAKNLTQVQRAAWSRARQAVLEAGYVFRQPLTVASNQSVFRGHVGAAAGYSADTDTIYINPAGETWADPNRYMAALASGRHSSRGHPDHVLVHELGHCAHRQAVGLKNYRAVPRNFRSRAQAELVARTVSVYAATEPSELVAEVYAMLVFGVEVPANTMKLYRLYGGPDVEFR